MKRSKAAGLIDDIRVLAARGADPGCDLGSLLACVLVDYGLAPLVQCHGEAHSNLHIDNCMACAPRWGYVGAKEKVT